MRILVDITHPAHALFFRETIARLRNRGDDVRITSRDKDVTLALLDAWKYPHTCLSRVGYSKFQLLREMVVRDLRMVREIRRFRPDLVLAKHGLFACQSAWLARVPSVAFDDTDTAPIQQRLYFPFATRVYTDKAYAKEIGPKQRRYRAVSPLAYLHPTVFQPDSNVLRRHGLSPEEGVIVCRLVTWTSNHDGGHHGLDLKWLPKALAALSAHGRVVITSEVPLPGELDAYRLRIPAADLHHVMAFSKLYFGESTTMAAESAVLGVPAINFCSRPVWFTTELATHGLCHNVGSSEAGLARALELLAQPNLADEYRKRQETYLATADDLNDVILQAIDEFRPQDSQATHGSERRAA